MAHIVTGDSGIHDVVEALRRGDVVGFPTETVYGLAADIRNEAALQRIFSVKGRPTSHPLIVHIADFDQLHDLAVGVSPACLALLEICWPGPLTVVVSAAPHVSRVCTGGRDSIAVRLPAHPLAQMVIRELGAPVAAPSANRFGHVSPTSALHVANDLGDDITLVLDGGPCAVGVESSIVDFSVTPPEILRPGSITAEEIRAILNHHGTDLSTSSHGPSRAPGMMDRHYAPRARLVLHEAGDPLPVDGAPILRFDTNLVDAARHLYERLRELDARHIPLAHVVLPTPSGLGFALRDRLSKAAAGL